MNRHVFLNNERSDRPKFNRQRNIGGNKNNQQEKEDIEDNVPKVIQEFQKERLRQFNADFYTKRKLRQEKRKIEFPNYIDLIKVKFYNVFSNDANYKLKLKDEFYARYGLFPVEYKDFNKTVLFEIVDYDLFEEFKRHLKIIINSSIGATYQNKEYNLISLIYEFEFIDSKSRIYTYNNQGVLINLFQSILLGSDIQKEYFFGFLNENKISFTYSDITPDIIEIHQIDKQRIQFLADNFDIIKAITSSRTQKLIPGYNGPIRSYNFELEIKDNLTKVGIIDTGVEKIEPLQNLILTENIDHTNNGAFWDEVGHGTMIAGLIVLGDEFYNSIKSSYDAKAKVFVIKVLQKDNDPIDIPRLINDIKICRREHGIRIFNMSLVIPNAKKYNETFSQFAYELDKLSHEEDLLIFISVGNFNQESLKALLEEEPHPDHDYPDFFYKLDGTTNVHKCEDTNICVPSESLNNISVGALAGNLENIDNTDITPNEVYPAYYSRKFHYDYSQNLNSQPIKQKNKHLNKPDFIFEGGDLFDIKSGLEVLRSPMAPTDKFYGRSCGTSLATPLVTSYSCDILNEYPNLKTQTVKALLINSANYFNKSKLPHFKNKPDSLLKSLTGFGKPNKEGLISNNNNTITFLIEDSIKVGEIIKIPIVLPEYLKESGNKLQFDISLCYSFLPIKDNQLDYLPLHISFNLVQNTNIDDIANGVIKKGEDTKLETPIYGIKNFPWSEDHFSIDNRQFSNSQFMQYRLQPNDYNLINSSLALSVRCLIKNSYIKQYEKINNSFSIVVKITEIISNDGDSNLYSEMLKINNHNEISGVIESGFDLESEN
ncbi:MAG TPA: S8 family peptidase [Flavobacterium lutivivi]|nr:S8 family peptidase [Flavobacterium lutivivi]